MLKPDWPRDVDAFCDVLITILTAMIAAGILVLITLFFVAVSRLTEAG